MSLHNYNIFPTHHELFSLLNSRKIHYRPYYGVSLAAMVDFWQVPDFLRTLTLLLTLVGAAQVCTPAAGK